MAELWIKSTSSTVWMHSTVVIGKKYLRPFFDHGCHGNAEIHMHTKFDFHALHGLQV